ncbi:MAG TPA: DUF4290 domain-containing protein [Chitinophagaceae bacterium]|nr:DUF4290 domain-containing protein [Chitinophagaceae bacterium]
MELKQMEYNTSRKGLVMPEYGRNIQKLVDYIKTIENKEKRQKYAEEIVKYMSIVNPQANKSEESESKFWDHLFIMADYDLDIESPFPVLTKEVREAKPKPLAYPKAVIKNRHLGKNIHKVIDKALQEEDEEKQKQLAYAVGYYMKMAYNNWHYEPIHDDMIREELLKISNGKLNIDEHIKVHARSKRSHKNHRNSRSKTNHRNHRNNSRGRNNSNRRK